MSTRTMRSTEGRAHGDGHDEMDSLLMKHKAITAWRHPDAADRGDQQYPRIE